MPNIYRGREGHVKSRKRPECYRHNPRDSQSHQKLEGSTLKPLEGTSPAENPISDFKPLEQWENKYMLS